MRCKACDVILNDYAEDPELCETCIGIIESAEAETDVEMAYTGTQDGSQSHGTSDDSDNYNDDDAAYPAPFDR